MALKWHSDYESLSDMEKLVIVERHFMEESKDITALPEEYDERMLRINILLDSAIELGVLELPPISFAE